MDIFGVYDSNNPTGSLSRNQGRREDRPQRKKKATAAKKEKRAPIEQKRERRQLSPEEIKAKVAQLKGATGSKVQISTSAKKRSENLAAKKDNSDQLPQEESAPNNAIGNNDPTNVVTQQKLKEALVNNSFSFNDGEKKVLAEILGS